MSSGDVETQLQINSVIRRVHQALVNADTRRELENRVCKAFADSEPYVFAWIGVYDADSDRVRPRAIGGQSRDYLDEISITVHDSPSARGPTATAIRTETVQVIQNIRNDPDYEPWRRQALKHGFESSAAVPLADDSGLYGVLNLYSDRPEAFGDSEQTPLEELGATIATAIRGLTARQELRAQKQKYERLTERISTAYYAVDEDWTITYWNDQMAARTGTQASEVVGRSLWKAFPELLGTTNETEYRTAMREKEHRSFETYLDDPYDYWVEIDVYPDDDGLSVFSREITERKARERELTRAKRRLDAIVENTSEAIYIKDRGGEYLFINEVGAEVFDSTPEEIVGKTDSELFDSESVSDIRADDKQVMEDEESQTWERVRYVDGDELVFIDDKFPYRDERGEVVGIMGVSRDITERKRYERQLEEQRDALDVLNEIVRHDIRNNLELIGGYSDQLTEHVGAGGEDYLDIVRNNAESAVELTNSAADLARAIRNDSPDYSSVALHTVLKTQIADIQNQSDDVSVEVTGELPQTHVLADDMLASLFGNLLRNAVVHNDKETPELTISATETGEMVSVEIADNGPGVPVEDRSRVFGKGEKGVESEGTGIGLYLAQTLVDRYGGEIRVEDNAPEGAVFIITLPTVE